MTGIASLSNAVKGQSITDDANLRDAGGPAHPKTWNGFFMATFSLQHDIKGCKLGRNMIFKSEKFLTHFFNSCSRVCSEIWEDPNPGATFKCFPNCRSGPRGNNSSCKWANIAEDILGLMKLGWLMFLCSSRRTYLEQPVLVTLSCFLREKQFNQRQLNDLILKRQLSLGSKSSKSPGSYKHPPIPLPCLSPIQCKN